MSIVTLASLKGGVGKTTLAIHLAVLAARSGKRVLLCDADANNNATDFLLDDVAGEAIDAANLLHVLTNRRALGDCVYASRHGITVLPATVALSELSVHTNANPVLLFSLRATLLATDYDLVVIDAPPYRGAELRAALWAADLVLAPVAPRRWTLQGMQYLERELHAAAGLTGHVPELRAIATMLRNTEQDRLRLALLRKRYRFLKSEIPRRESIASAMDGGRVLLPEHRTGLFFEILTGEVLGWQNTKAASKKQKTG